MIEMRIFLLTIRIILSPAVFLFYMAALIILPVGILTLCLGSAHLLLCVIAGKPLEQKDVLITFSLVTIPYIETLNFIKWEK